MPVHVALLRAVNVGGTGKLLMAELRSLCEDLGFADVRTYIQSGNLIFRCDLSAADAGKALDDALARIMGKPPGVIVTGAERLQALVDDNPFPDAKPNYLMINFLAEKPAANALDDLVAPDGEKAHLAGHEIYVNYPLGSGRSRLTLKILRKATARNLNTVQKLAELARAMETG